MEHSTFERLRKHWQLVGADPLPGVEHGALMARQHELGLRFPSSIAAYFLVVNGTRSVDEHNFEAWPLSRFVSLVVEASNYKTWPAFARRAKELPDSSRWFVFGDWLVSSALFAVRLGDVDGDTPVLWICNDSFELIADTFLSFWDGYLSDPRLVER